MFAFYFVKFVPFILAKTGDDCTLPGQNTKQFFFFPHWWQYLKGQEDFLGNCTPQVKIPHDLWLIGLAVLNILLALAGFLAVVSIIIAGVELITSEGSPEKATNARNRLINSLLGVAIAVSATALVAFLGHKIGGAGTGLPKTPATHAAIQDIANIAFAILGALAFLFVVLAGVRFITYADNPTKVAEARRQIIFAVLGLVVISMAATLVNFVLGHL
jgi:hypothetical protein